MARTEKRLLSDNDDESENITVTSREFRKDSWQSFLICFALLVNRAFINGVLHSWGLFLVAFVQDMKSSTERAAWIGSVAYGLSMFFGPIASVLVNRFGERAVLISGGLLCAVAVFGSSFVTQLNQMFGTFSLIYGIGACMAISPTMTIAPKYFDKYMTLAVGLMTAGSSLGTLVMAPLSQTLIDAIGWRKTFRCFAGTCLFSALCCCLVRPLPASSQDIPLETIKRSSVKDLMKDLKLWKNRVFIVWTCAIACVMFGYYIPYVHLVSYAQTVGIPPEKGTMIIMVLGITTAVGRIMFGKIAGLGVLNRLHMHQLSMVVSGTAVMLLPLIRSFTGIIIYVIIIGMVDGCYVVLLPVLTVSLMAGENSVTAWGFLIGASSVTFTLGPPIAGALYDELGSYNVAFHCAGIPLISGAIILFFIPWAQRTSRTNNALVVVSNMDCDDREKYDFADDLIEEARSFERRSVNDTDIDDIKLDFPANRKSPSRRYRDQCTSTSPDNIQHVPQDLTEAISMLQENARLISEMLANSNPQPRTETAQSERRSAVSRSEMVQPTVMEVLPKRMISIMSIPGGLTISHWEPAALNASDSISNPPSMLASQSLLQNTQSFHSRNLSEYTGSPGTQIDSPGQNMGIIVSPTERIQMGSPGQSIIVSPPERTQMGSPRQSMEIIVSPNEKIQIGSPGQTIIVSPPERTQIGSPGQNMGFVVSPNGRTQIGSRGHNRGIIVSPSGRTQNPYLYTPTTSVQNSGISSTQTDVSTTGKIHTDLLEGRVSGTTSTTGKIHTDLLEDRVSGTTSTKFLSPPQQQTQSPKHSPTAGLSPRAKVMSPVLCSIPEIMNGQAGANELTAGNDPDKWINYSAHDSHQNPAYRSDSGGSLASDSLQGSPRAVQSDSSVSAKESDSASSHAEIDVFKHLFNDQDEPIV